MPMRKRKRVSTRQLLIKANDDIFRQIIRNRDRVCQKTGRATNLQVAHFWRRNILRTRWDLENACLLQKDIHYYWAHAHYLEFREFWINRIGQKRFDALEIRARYVAPVKEQDLLLIHHDLKKELLKSYKKI